MQQHDSATLAMYVRINEVFPRTLLDSFAPQQIRQINNAIHRVLEEEGMDALKIPRLEGNRELVTEYLWSPALTNLTQKYD